MRKAFTSENITCEKYGAVQLNRQVKLSASREETIQKVNKNLHNSEQHWTRSNRIDEHSPRCIFQTFSLIFRREVSQNPPAAIRNVGRHWLAQSKWVRPCLFIVGFHDTSSAI